MIIGGLYSVLWGRSKEENPEMLRTESVEEEVLRGQNMLTDLAQPHELEVMPVGIQEKIIIV